MAFSDLEKLARDAALNLTSDVESVTYKALGAGPGTAINAHRHAPGYDPLVGSDFGFTAGGAPGRVVRLCVSTDDVATLTLGKDLFTLVPDEGGAAVDYVVSRILDKSAAWWDFEVTR